MPNETEAEVVCSLLRAHAIECAHRGTDVAAQTFGGWHEVLVREMDVERALEVLARGEE